MGYFFLHSRLYSSPWKLADPRTQAFCLPKVPRSRSAGLEAAQPQAFGRRFKSTGTTQGHPGEGRKAASTLGKAAPLSGCALRGASGIRSEKRAARATGSRGGGEAATFPPPSNRRAWVRRPRWGPAPRLPWSGSPAGAGREAGGGWGSAGRTRGASCSPPAPPDVAKANNRGDAEKQKAIRHDPHGLCGVVLRGGHLGGGQEGG